jgi:hypothetical protein
MKDLQKLAMHSRYPNIVITVSVITYFFTARHVGDSIAEPSLLQVNLPFIFAWIVAHFAIGWASATHAWNGLIATLDSALIPKRRAGDRTEHEERLESVLGLVRGTRLTALIAPAFFILAIVLSVLNDLLSGSPLYISEFSWLMIVLLAVSPGLFAFASWAFLNGRVTEYYLKVRPAIDKALPEEPFWDE